MKCASLLFRCVAYSRIPPRPIQPETLQKKRKNLKRQVTGVRSASKRFLSNSCLFGTPTETARNVKTCKGSLKCF